MDSQGRTGTLKGGGHVNPNMLEGEEWEGQTVLGGAAWPPVLTPDTHAHLHTHGDGEENKQFYL